MFAHRAGAEHEEKELVELHHYRISKGDVNALTNEQICWERLPIACGQVSLWVDLTQPGGEVEWSKPVRGKSKG